MSLATQGFGGTGLATSGYGVVASVVVEERRKGGGGGHRRKRDPLRPILRIINREPETAFEKAFIQARSKQVDRQAKEAIIRGQVKIGKLKDFGELSKLSDEDLILILLLMD